MNKMRRKEVENVIEILNDAVCQLESIVSDEQDAFDNLPEGLQCSERGEGMEENVNDMEDAVSTICDVISSLEDVVGR